MQPKYIEFQAFGPYVEKQIIDFDVFEHTHLFLIRGETGSGKTMILDAITYALYGKSSGGQREDLLSMRSRFAQDEEPTYLDYQFLLHGHHYRFYRKVEIRRNRAQEIVSKVSVDAGEIIDGVFYPFYEKPKLKNIEEKAVELIGLTHDQFIQVMILPQGKFEQLLVSKSEEKQEILKTLFQMDRWEKINDYLVNKTRTMKSEIDEKKQQMQAYLLSAGKADIEELHEWLKSAREAEGKLLDLSHQRTKDCHRIREDYQQQKTLHSLVEEQTKARSAWDTLQQREPEMQRLQECIAKQVLLQELTPFVQQEHLLQVAFDKRTKSLQQAQERLASLQESYGKQEIRESQKQQARIEKETVSNSITTLSNHQLIYEQYEEKRSSALQLEQIFQQALQKQRNLQVEYTSQEERLRQDILHLQKLKSDVMNQQEVEETFAKLDKAHYFYEQQCLVETLRKKEADSLRNSQNEVLTYQERWEHTTAKHELLYRQFLDNSATQLAAQLTQGTPCPVCGSLDHPAVAYHAAQVVDVMTLRTLQKQMDEEKQKVALWQEDVAKKQAQWDSRTREIEQFQLEITHLLGDSFSQEQYECVQKQRSEILQKLQLIQKLQDTIDRNTLQLQQSQDVYKRLEQISHEKELALTICQSELQTYQLQLFADIPTWQDLRKRIQLQTAKMLACSQQIERMEKEIQQVQADYERAVQAVLQSEQEVQEAKQQLLSAQITLQEQCRKRTIDIQDISQIVTSEQLHQKQEEWHTYETSCTRLKTTLEDVTKRLMGVEIRDLGDVAKQLQEAERCEESTKKELIELQTQKQRYLETAKRVDILKKDVEVKEPVYLKMNQFVKNMRGDNGIGIERYVLGIMLSSITQHANQLLGYVHHGRYQIFRSDEASGRTRKFGLELSIYDSYSATHRSVVSLSGGEKFLVSLALSLALSTVVQARNGGIHLDAMFIDEGFGTLDEHSIADALQVLQTMGSHRGLVGIISHVEMLKENIPAGIEVIKSRKGSSINIRKD